MNHFRLWCIFPGGGVEVSEAHHYMRAFDLQRWMRRDHPRVLCEVRVDCAELRRLRAAQEASTPEARPADECEEDLRRGDREGGKP